MKPVVISPNRRHHEPAALHGDGGRVVAAYIENLRLLSVHGDGGRVVVAYLENLRLLSVVPGMLNDVSMLSYWMNYGNISYIRPDGAVPGQPAHLAPDQAL